MNSLSGSGSITVAMTDKKFLDSLNDMQKEAVLYFDSPLLILAGAGSGKTRVLTHKIAYIIDSLGNSPYSVLAVTFTNKAANEMKQRVEHMLNRQIQGMWIGTFHSMCVRMIRKYRKENGLNYNFTIYDALDARNIIKKIIKDSGYEEDLNLKATVRTISNLKNKLISPSTYASIAENEMQEKVFEIYDKYEKFLTENNGLDFDSLLKETVRIMQDDETFRKKLAGSFTHILVDEYQDTNYAQYLLLKLLSMNNHITVVGDDDQSIYAFRGADIRNILDFEKDFRDTHIIKLEQNYRSTGNILDAASGLIACNRERKGKTLWSGFKNGDKVHIVNAADEKDEANFVVSTIQELNEQGIRLSDCTLLYRTNAQSRPFEEVLRRRGISYKVIGGTKFFERREIKDILAYLSVCVNHLDNVSLLRVINVPKRGIGKKGEETIVGICQENGISVHELIMNYEKYDAIPASSLNGMKNLRKIFGRLEDLKDDAEEAVIQAIEITGYNDYLGLESPADAISRRENLQELINSAGEFKKNSDEDSLEDYINMISLFTDIDEKTDADDIVSMMTVHNAKGLEFDNVFVTGLEEGLFPHINSFESEAGIEEERRLMYVAMTRARKGLYLTHCSMRSMYGRSSMTDVSRFIREIPMKSSDTASYVNGSLYREEKTERMAKGPVKVKHDDAQLGINDRIIHPYWGVGTIKGIKGSGDNMIAIIRFITGETKKIYVKYANLQKK